MLMRPLLAMGIPLYSGPNQSHTIDKAQEMRTEAQTRSLYGSDPAAAAAILSTCFDRFSSASSSHSEESRWSRTVFARQRLLVIIQSIVKTNVPSHCSLTWMVKRL